MIINRYNLSISKHIAPNAIDGFITNGLQFNETGTIAINRCYSIAVSALQVTEGEAVGCVSSQTVANLEARVGEGITAANVDVNVKGLARLAGKRPIIKLPEKPVLFEMTLSANFLLRIAEAARDFSGPEHAILRIQFTGQDDPVRMDARNDMTGQKWEAILMPRQSGTDTAWFAERTPVPPPPPPSPDVCPHEYSEFGRVCASCFPAVSPPPSAEDEALAAALALANQFAGL